MSTIKKATWLHTFPSDKQAVRDIVRRLADAGLNFEYPNLLDEDLEGLRKLRPGRSRNT